jgi:DNA-binding response OmpR family regulator
MIADYMTKPLQGKKFLDMRKMLLDQNKDEDEDEDVEDPTEDLGDNFH